MPDHTNCKNYKKSSPVLIFFFLYALSVCVRAGAEVRGWTQGLHPVQATGIQVSVVAVDVVVAVVVIGHQRTLWSDGVQ